MSKGRTLEELRKDGVKIRPVLTEDEFIDWAKLGVLCGETNAIAAKYRVHGYKQWARDLQHACTLTEKIINERLAMLESKAVRAVINRRSHAKMIVDINYSKRVEPNEKEITVDVDTFEDVVEMALIQTCEGCKRCDWRQCRHYGQYIKLCVPVFDDSGEVCPYQYDALRIYERKQTAKNNEVLRV